MDNEQAFAGTSTSYYGESGEFSTEIHHPGLTKREYIAIAALQGLLSCPDALLNYESLGSPNNIGEAAVIYADLLIAALNRP